MAAWLLQRARDAVASLPDQRREELALVLRLRPGESDDWDHISRWLTIAFHDDEAGQPVVSQFRGYDRLEEFDWQGYRAKYGDIQRLDRILEAEGDTTNRYRLSKQADVLMLFYLLSAEELAQLFTLMGYDFHPDLIPRTIAYYLGRTSHGSTLSRVVHSRVLARSDRAASWDFFVEALESDIADIQGGTTSEGIHLGAMSGTIDLVERGWTGLHVRDDVLHLDPLLPRELRCLQLSIRYRHVWGLGIKVTADRLTVTMPQFDGAPIRVGVGDRVVDLQPGTSTDFALPGPTPGESGSATSVSR